MEYTDIMKNMIELFFKGVLIGIGKIVPGVSGSFLAISLGVYEETIERISSLKKDFRKHLSYLFPLFLGISFSIIFGSRFILLLLDKYYVWTMLFFIGLLVGTLPSLFQEHLINIKDGVSILLLFLLLLFLFSNLSFSTFIFKNQFWDYMFLFFLGMVELFTTILPGISSTATYMMLGSYEFVLDLFAHPFQDFGILLVFGFGFLFGLILFLKVFSFLFQKKSKLLWNILYAFLLYALYFLFQMIVDEFYSSSLFIQLLLLILGFQIGNLCSRS